MSGSPPHIDTMGASHSAAAARHFSSGTMSLRLVEYSRIRPQPVHVKLQVCKGLSCNTMANLGVRRSLCLITWPAIFAESAKGNRISLFLDFCYLNYGWLNCGHRLVRMNRRGISLQQTRHEKVERRDAL